MLPLHDKPWRKRQKTCRIVGSRLFPFNTLPSTSPRLWQTRVRSSNLERRCHISYPIRVSNPQQHEVVNDEDKPFSTRQTSSGSTFSYIYTTCTVLCAGTRLWRHSRWNCLTTSTSFLLTRPVRSSWLSGLAPTSTVCYVAIHSSSLLTLLSVLCCLLTDIRVS